MLIALAAARTGSGHLVVELVMPFVAGRRLGEHAVKVVGYGVGGPNATEYWECLNSWGGDWGNNGTFRIAVGECGFELNVLSGDPCLPNSLDPTCFTPPS